MENKNNLAVTTILGFFYFYFFGAFVYRVSGVIGVFLDAILILSGVLLFLLFMEIIKNGKTNKNNS
jgi:hypothetical protein